MHKKSTTVIVFCLVLFGGSHAGAVVHDITIGNNFFLPLGTHVQPGDTVRWTWVGSLFTTHSTTSDMGAPKNWTSLITGEAGFTFEQVFTAGDGPGPFPYHCATHFFTMKDTIHVDAPAGCCVGSRGDVNGDARVDITDVTDLIDHLYVSNSPAGCPESANVNGDSLGINMADVILLLDHIFRTFRPLPMCTGSTNSLQPDLGVADTVSLIVADTQSTGNDLIIGLQLWLFNDGDDVIGAEMGFSWSSPNLRMDSALTTPLADSLFRAGRSVTFDNTTRQFNFVGIDNGLEGLPSSTTANHVATYWLTYINWMSDSAIIFDTARFRNTGYGFVGKDDLMWFPEFIAQGIAGVVNDFGYSGNGSATVSDVGGVVTVSNIGASGNDGVAIQVPTGGSFVGMEIGNIDLAQPDISLTMEVSGEVGAPVGKSSGNLPPQLVGTIGIATPGGAIQLSADFSSIGDPNVQFEVYNGPLLTGGASIPGGGVVAIGSNAGFGMPVVTSLTYQGSSLPGYTVNLDRVARFTLTNGTILVGDKIRLLAANATGTVDLISTVNVNASGIGFFTLTGVTTSSTGFCCLGFTGNINCDPTDLVDIADLTVLIDHLFINFPPLCCRLEGNIDGDVAGNVDITDLTALIDFLFINFTVPSACQ